MILLWVMEHLPDILLFCAFGAILGAVIALVASYLD